MAFTFWDFASGGIAEPMARINSSGPGLGEQALAVRADFVGRPQGGKRRVLATLPGA